MMLVLLFFVLLALIVSLGVAIALCEIADRYGLAYALVAAALCYTLLSQAGPVEVALR